jgi:nucleotide-binding universal stress UspA family protein
VCSVLISKILVAIDGTESGTKALDFALDLAEKYDASVVILNVLDVPVYGILNNSVTTLSSSSSVFLNDLRRIHHNALDQASEHAAALKPNVKVITELREGSPPDQIVLAAAEGVFDVVVVGHGAKGKVRRMFLGRTSERVAHLARCAVLIVK